MKTISKITKKIFFICTVSIISISCSNDDSSDIPPNITPTTTTILEVIYENGDTFSQEVEKDQILTDDEGFIFELTWTPEEDVNADGDIRNLDIDLYIDAPYPTDIGLGKYHSASVSPSESVTIENTDQDTHGNTFIKFYTAYESPRNGQEINYELKIRKLSNNVAIKTIYGNIIYDTDDVLSEYSIIGQFIKSGSQFYFEYQQ